MFFFDYEEHDALRSHSIWIVCMKARLYPIDLSLVHPLIFKNLLLDSQFHIWRFHANTPPTGFVFRVNNFSFHLFPCRDLDFIPLVISIYDFVVI